MDLNSEDNLSSKIRNDLKDKLKLKADGLRPKVDSPKLKADSPKPKIDKPKVKLGKFSLANSKNLNKILIGLICTIVAVCAVIVIFMFANDNSATKITDNKQNKIEKTNPTNNANNTPNNTVDKPSTQTNVFVPTQNSPQVNFGNQIDILNLNSKKVDVYNSLEVFRQYQQPYKVRMLLRFGDPNSSEWAKFSPVLDEIQAQYQGVLVVQSIDINGKNQFSNISFKKTPAYVYVSYDGNVGNIIYGNVPKEVIVAGLSCMGISQ